MPIGRTRNKSKIPFPTQSAVSDEADGSTSSSSTSLENPIENKNVY